jgi:hypothetical protein
MEKTKQTIQEEVADALIETEEIKSLREDIADKELEIEENEHFELDDAELDDEIDNIYDEVEVAGVKRNTSYVLKMIDETMYEQMRTELSDTIREDRAIELEDELEELESELQDLLGDDEEEEEE